jgi:hypothetical protein
LSVFIIEKYEGKDGQPAAFTGMAVNSHFSKNKGEPAPFGLPGLPREGITTIMKFTNFLQHRQGKNKCIFQRDYARDAVH